jgi:MinD-like ATPase involved in chromosome partitioning or flagellar assembly
LYTITFYSFRGGVGRTMALVNVGLELVRRGRRVLLVDFDLEAPGLSNYEQLRPRESHAGVVEFVTAYREGYEREEVSPDVTKFIYSVDLRRFKRWPGRPKRGRKRSGLGKLWVMPAGKADAAYSRALMSLDWAKLYAEQEGYLFFEDTKGQWQEALKPDYVLIDSRTGHSEVEGICTRQLADAVVLMFFPNEQNLHGLSDVCRAIRQEKVKSGKGIQINLVMSNVPRLDDEKHILRRQVDRFLETLEFRRVDGVIHHSASLLHVDQHLFVLDHPRSHLAQQYRALTMHLMKHNRSEKKRRRSSKSLNPYVRVHQGKPPDLEKAILMDRYGPLDMDLRRFVNQAATRPSWADAWEYSTRGRRMTDPLNAQASPEERLAVFHQIKASGDLPAAAGFYLVADQAEFLLLCNLADKHEKDDRRIEASLDEFAPRYQSKAWDEACDLCKKNPAEWDRLYQALLRKVGEEEMARVYVLDRERFQELLREGKRFFYPNAEQV